MLKARELLEELMGMLQYGLAADTECALVFLSIIFYVPGKGPGTCDYGSQQSLV
jgi:hypothetical protein